MLETNISFQQALKLVLDHVPRLPSEEAPLYGLGGRILAEDAVARVDSPSVNASLKDGYAVHSRDVAAARPESPVTLELKRFQAAGDPPGRELEPGSAVRVTTGAPLPPGADAVLADEFAREEGRAVRCLRDAGPGRNVLPKGTDVRVGQVAARRGEKLDPALIGLLAAAGLDRARVAARPRVRVIATGDEVLAPGRPLEPGKLYASNIVETMAWLDSFGLTECTARVVPDRAEEINAAIQEAGGEADAFLTSGGAWKSERDLMLGLLEGMGWQGIFHRVRLGPGKAAGFGLIESRPFFILPGGPPSHEAAFLLLALPGLLAMSGWQGPVFPRVRARLEETIGGKADWTQVIHARLYEKDGTFTARPLESASRLLSMARKNALILLPEGVSHIEAGEDVRVEVLGQEFNRGETF